MNAETYQTLNRLEDDSAPKNLRRTVSIYRLRREKWASTPAPGRWSNPFVEKPLQCLRHFC